jgi:hypothetical protein
VDADFGGNFVVERLVRGTEGRGHARRCEDVPPPGPRLCPSEVFFQPPAVIVVVLAAATRRPWCEPCEVNGGSSRWKKDEVASRQSLQRRSRRRRRFDPR